MAILLLVASIAGAAIIIAVAPKPAILVDPEASPQAADFRPQEIARPSSPESVFVGPLSGPRGR